MFRNIIAIMTSVIAFTAAANAADVYRAPGAGSYKDGPAYAAVDWSGLYVGLNAGYGWSANTDYLDPTGGFGGGQIGYNIQRGNLVFGLETDLQGAGISDSNSIDKSEMNWFGTLRGRAGYAFDRALIYGTGGLAYGGVHNAGWGSETQTGWVIGGGLEYKLSPAWSVKGEYQYLDLDANSWVGPLGEGYETRTQVHTVRVGVNYFVGSGYQPLK
jgi:outer membrane immunogenic protein